MHSCIHTCRPGEWNQRPSNKKTLVPPVSHSHLETGISCFSVWQAMQTCLNLCRLHWHTCCLSPQHGCQPEQKGGKKNSLFYFNVIYLIRMYMCMYSRKTWSGAETRMQLELVSTTKIILLDRSVAPVCFWVNKTFYSTSVSPHLTHQPRARAQRLKRTNTWFLLVSKNTK